MRLRRLSPCLMLSFSCLFKSTMIDRSIFRKGSGWAGTGSSMILQFTQQLKKNYQFSKMKMCFLCQIVNKDSNTPHAKKIFHRKIRRNGSIIQEAISMIPKNEFLYSSEHGFEAAHCKCASILQINNNLDTLRNYVKTFITYWQKFQ